MTARELLLWIALGLFAAWEAVAHLRAWRARRAAAAAERAWRETVRRCPWRVAAVLDGGPLVLLVGDAALRLWWEGEGRAKYPALARMADDATKGPTE